MVPPRVFPSWRSLGARLELGPSSARDRWLQGLVRKVRDKLSDIEALARGSAEIFPGSISAVERSRLGFSDLWEEAVE